MSATRFLEAGVLLLALAFIGVFVLLAIAGIRRLLNDPLHDVLTVALRADDQATPVLRELQANLDRQRAELEAFAAAEPIGDQPTSLQLEHVAQLLQHARARVRLDRLYEPTGFPVDAGTCLLCEADPLQLRHAHLSSVIGVRPEGYSVGGSA